MLQIGGLPDLFLPFESKITGSKAQRINKHSIYHDITIPYRRFYARDPADLKIRGFSAPVNVSIELKAWGQKEVVNWGQGDAMNAFIAGKLPVRVDSSKL
jgi:hypothetical protein